MGGGQTSDALLRFMPAGESYHLGFSAVNNSRAPVAFLRRRGSRAHLPGTCSLATACGKKCGAPWVAAPRGFWVLHLAGRSVGHMASVPSSMILATRGFNIALYMSLLPATRPGRCELRTSDEARVAA